MSKDLIQALEEAKAALSIALSDVDWRPKSPTQGTIHKAYCNTDAALSRHRSSVESVGLPEPEGYRTEHEDTDMFWRPEDLLEARSYCDDDIEPEPLYTASTVRSLIAAAVERATEEANRRANASWSLMAKKMVAAERTQCYEACIRVAEHQGTVPRNLVANECAAAIRSRGEMK